METQNKGILRIRRGVRSGNNSSESRLLRAGSLKKRKRQSHIRRAEVHLGNEVRRG